MTTLFPTNIKMSKVEVKEYRLMYKFGSWTTALYICAESLKEAIADATDYIKESNLKHWEYSVALFCGNKMVHKF